MHLHLWAMTREVPISVRLDDGVKSKEEENMVVQGTAILAGSSSADNNSSASESADGETGDSVKRKNPDYWVKKTNAVKLTRVGLFFKHALDPVILPVVDKPGGWIVVSIGLGIASARRFPGQIIHNSYGAQMFVLV